MYQICLNAPIFQIFLREIKMPENWAMMSETFIPASDQDSLTMVGHFENLPSTSKKTFFPGNHRFWPLTLGFCLSRSELKSKQESVRNCEYQGQEATKGVVASRAAAAGWELCLPPTADCSSQLGGGATTAFAQLHNSLISWRWLVSCKLQLTPTGAATHDAA